MCPEQHCLQQAHRQRGAGLPLAIFLITVMALLVATIAQLQQTTGEAEASDIQATRAYYAAESGAQLGMTLQAEGAGCGFGERVFDGLESGLGQCEARVTCSETGDSGDVFRLVSEGVCGQASRTVEVMAQ